MTELERTKKKIYIFDTSAFSAMLRQHLHVMEIPQLIWDTMESMLKERTIISHEFVFNEVVTENSQNPDLITTWLSPYKSNFESPSEEQAHVVASVVKLSPKLIESDREKEQADPWLIAQASLYNSQLNLLNDCEYIIVTQENKRSPKKIPLAASNFSVNSISLREFFEEIDIKITASVAR